jgi:ribosomal protein S12 methylthiotransferase accessory factor
LLSERGHSLLRGPLFGRLVPLLDGSRDEDEIARLLAGDVQPAEVHYALRVLARRGSITESDPSIAPDRAAFLAGLGLDPAAAERRVRAATIGVETAGDVVAAPVRLALEAMGVRVVAGAGDLTVVLTDDYLQAGLDERNAAALAAGRPWLLVRPVGTILWIGPLFHPGATACWECLAERLRWNRLVERLLGDGAGAGPAGLPRASLDASLQVCVHLAAIEVVRAVGAGEPPAEAVLTTLDLRELETRRHAVVRRPQCPRCGDRGPAREPVRVTVGSQPKRFTADGGHRTVSPEQTLAAYERHVSPITGAVTVLRDVSADGGGLVRYTISAHASPRPVGSLAGLRQALQEVSAGKGATNAQARASGLCEALERYSACAWGDEVRRPAAYRRLRASAIHPNDCMLFSARQHAARAEWNARGSIHEQVPLPFDEDAEVDWTPVWSLTACEFRHLPTELCYAHTAAGAGGRRCLADSNGNAAGNTVEEAILQGFLELVERDGVGLWWYSRARRPAVDLDSFDDRHVQQLLGHYRVLGRDIWALDLTTDLGIPVFAAISRRVDQAREEIVWGFGAHLDARIGVLRALSELGQHLPRTWPEDRPGQSERDPWVERWLAEATLAAQPYLAPGPGPARRRGDYADDWSDDLRDDVLRCQATVERRGMELLVLDQTRPEIGLPVVKVIVPGLRHFRPRLAPGRLYDVPAALGWVDRPLTEGELNPIPYRFP